MGLVFYFLSVVFAIIAYIGFDIYQVHSLGSIFHESQQSDFSTCKRILDIKGCEDLVIHHPSGYAFAGCPEDYLLHKNLIGGLGYSPREGLVLSNHSYFVSYNLLEQKSVKLTTKGFPEGVEFGIHGVDVLQDPKDKNVVHLFAVNHRRNSIDTVEHFKHTIGTTEIEYVKSFESGCLKHINALAAIDLDTFYYTQFVTHGSGPLNFLESKGLWQGGKVMYYGGQNDCQELARGLKFSNGIAFSPDRKLLYVAETHRSKLHIFERDDGPELELKEVVPLKFAPDNLRVDPRSGHIYIAGFSTDLKEMEKILRYDGDVHQATAKSVVARVVNETGEGRFFGQNYRVEPILIDHGDTMFSTTTAAVDENLGALLMTGLFTGKGMLDCRLDAIKNAI